MDSLDTESCVFLDCGSLSDFLYGSYVEISPLEDDVTAEYYQKLEELSGKLSLEDNNALFSAVVELCTLYARAYFSGGLQVGICFRTEITPVLCNPPESPVPACGQQFQTYLSNLSPSSLGQNAMTDLLRDCYMDKNFSVSPPVTKQIHLILERMHKKKIRHQDTLNLVSHLAVRYACKGFDAGFKTGLQLAKEYAGLLQRE